MGSEYYFRASLVSNFEFFVSSTLTVTVRNICVFCIRAKIEQKKSSYAFFELNERSQDAVNYYKKLNPLLFSGTTKLRVCAMPKRR